MRLAKSAFPNALLFPFFAPRRRKPSVPYKRTAIVKLGKLGDGVLALGAIKTLVAHFGGEHCVIVASPYTLDLFSAEFPSVEILVVTTNHSTLRRTVVDLHRHRKHPLFRSGVENLVTLQHHRTLHDDVMISAIPSSFAWGLKNSALGVFEQRDQIAKANFVFDNITLNPTGSDEICRELSSHSALVSVVIDCPISPEQLRPRIHVNESADSNAIGLAPFSGSALRDIPIALLVAACKRAQALALEVRIWTPSVTEPRAASLATHLASVSRAKVTLVQTTTTSDLVRAIAKAKVVIAAESAPAHLAAALDKPLLAVIGGGHFGWFAPWTTSGRQRWIFSRQSCYACNWRCIHPSAICITQIEEARFLGMLEDTLAS